MCSRSRQPGRRSSGACWAAAGGATEELLLADLQEARLTLEEIAGRRTPEAVIERIFESFCIGK